jgi:predicted dehydrogenase
MPEQIHRVALVGTGGISRAHTEAALRTDRAELVALCDVSQDSVDRYRERHPNVTAPAYLDMNEMLEKEEIDIAVICTWGAFHAEVGAGLARSGRIKAILCEKPFTQTAREAENLVAAVNDSDAFIAEAFKFRHHPMHLKARELIDAGAIGDVMAVRSTFYTWGGGSREEQKVRLDPDKNWRFNKLKGGGSIYDLACYNIHHARWTFGEDPVEVFATCRPGVEVDVAAHIQFVFPSGGVAQIGVGFDTYSSQEFHIIGESGSLHTDAAWNNENRPTWLDHYSPGKRTMAWAGGLTQRYHFGPLFQFQLQLEHMCDVVEGKMEHRIPSENSLGQMRTIDAIYESFESRKAVRL